MNLEMIEDHIHADDDSYEPDPLEEAEAECGLRHDGQCGLAGTEHCDFVCPFRTSEHFAGSAAWYEKHKPRKRKAAE